MLTYFPTPYPGEWWYSVLCRYHVRSGNQKYQTTIRELFSNRTTASIGALFPNSTIPRITAQLPDAIFNTRSIIWNNTLFPYYMRFYTEAEKTDSLCRLERGESTVITSIRRLGDSANWRPRYCPLCVTEDKQRYGEAYWHIVHQVPLMRVCPTHNCLLHRVSDSPQSRLNYIFLPLDSLDVNCFGGDCEPATWDLALSCILAEYQELPISKGITVGHNNLATILGNMGYGVIQKNSPYVILDARRLYADLKQFFGPDLIAQVFGGKDPLCHINRLGKWSIRSPERYALLQCFAGVRSYLVFDPVPEMDKYHKMLEEMAKTDRCWTKKQVQVQLNVTASQLDILIEKFNLSPFWRQTGTAEKERPHRVQCRFSKYEYQKYKEAFESSGYHYDSDFVRHCVLSYISQED